MKLGIFVFFTLLLGIENISAEEISKAYELSVFNEAEEQQSPGLPLERPGDRYRYTFVIEDEYSRNPDWHIKMAIVGVHILDNDWQTLQGDTKPEWGRILINGKSQKWIKPAHLTKWEYHKGQEPKNSDLMEIQSEFEVSNYKEGVPPYIFNVTEVVEQDRRLVIEVINVNQNGELNESAPFGSFRLLRAGLRVVWSKE